MTYIDRIATEIENRVPSEVMPDGDTGLLFRIYAVLLLAKGEQVTDEDVHNAWSVWMQENQGDHPALRPFSELDASARESDEPFVAAIRAAWREVN
ncbi:DUF7701 domain-containing protein [Paraconexibacter algicola]|uniref:DUF7701 domain-containing protein n=1 Tax=Paraconexibacter algicola TaxID=2133960 RepID=A0A2T4ULC8_9ACTN|nr:hypothetical protein [Paraconexibacter algicola]PTL60056.1 hypothetical protein C7Y72_10565 [Paraconexibacter algicola]